MITISRHQLDALQAAKDRAFAEKALGVLTRLWSARLGARDLQVLLNWASDGVGRGRALGFVTEKDVCGLLNLSLVLTEFAPTFDWPDWAGAILARRDRAPAERLAAVRAEWRRRIGQP
ncbi:MAG TPA: hypothetical protein VNE67_08025 [Acetobacteraceae bacterium]|nr:hypothetical protein [Acetobacteraceae bacterium]